LEGLGLSDQFWAGRSVFLTGHTGFKGGWLALWLAQKGAQVHGYALPAEQAGGVYATCNVASRLAGETLADIRDEQALRYALKQAKPEVVLHLAAQPLVRASYNDPTETMSTNVMGLVSVFEAIRACDSVHAVVNVTSDKCYENREWVWPYRENEALGGHDPYSASKACAEIITSSYRSSFFASGGPSVATARAGNVIGGGDCAEDRLLPDFLRAVQTGEPLTIRNPDATRPWQHVLDPLSGYLSLAEALVEQGNAFAEAWNFGPGPQDIMKVSEIADTLCAKLPRASWGLTGEVHPKEAQSLALDSSKARARLGWSGRWTIDTALARVLDWHIAWTSGADMADVTLEQIAEYEAT
jgi:CDP-glucose 4,6-dehydratase